MSEAAVQSSVCQIACDTEIEGLVDAAENFRYAISNVLIVPSPAGGWACATDGRAFAASQIYSDADFERRLIPGEAIVRMRKLSRVDARKGSSWGIEIRDGNASVKSNRGLSISFGEPEGKFPDVSIALGEVSEETHFQISIDAALLLRIAKAVNDVDAEFKNISVFASKKESSAPVLIVGERGVGALAQLDVSESENQIERYSRHRYSVLSATKANSED